MSRDQKTKQNRLVADLRGHREVPEVRQFLELFDTLREVTKTDMLSCDAIKFPQLQGEARAYTRLIELITRADLTPSKE